MRHPFSIAHRFAWSCIMAGAPLAVAMAQTPPVPAPPPQIQALSDSGMPMPPGALPAANSPPPPPMAAAAAPTLPPTALPAVPAVGQASGGPNAMLPVAPGVMPATPDADNKTMLSPAELAAELTRGNQQQKQFSYGDSPISLMFLPAQTEVMKKALSNFESKPVVPVEKKPETTAEPTVKFDIPVEVPKKIEEPEKYPVFYLSSIVYRAPNDWSVWVSGHKITSAKNKTDLTVTSITANQVSFKWQPIYAEALTAREEKKLFAETDAVKNRLSPNQNARLDKATGAVTFTLTTNQTFALAYFSIFEGFMDTPEYDTSAPTSDPAMMGAPGMPGQPGAGQNNQPDGDRIRPFAKPKKPGDTNAT
jgi:hypothetical protein